MKKILFAFFCFLNLLCFNGSVHPQCSSVTVEPYQVSVGNYKVRATLAYPYYQAITVTGNITPEEGAPIDSYELTIPANSLTGETETTWHLTNPNGMPVITSGATPCPNDAITVTYAGVTITYETDNHILKFNSWADVNAVLDQLDSDYENNYNSYDSQIDTSLSVERLDSIDEVNGFNPRKTFGNFESLFSGYNSKRAEIEGVESNWLYNNLSGTNPADVDLTYDDAQNTICNTDYSFKIGNDLYQIASDGIYINGTLQDEDGGTVAKLNVKDNEILMNNIIQDNDNNVSGPIFIGDNSFYVNGNLQDNGNSGFKAMTDCKSNKKDHHQFPYDNDTKMFEVEVAIHSIFYRTGIHGKVIHYKLKNNGHWKRSRAQMAAGCGGNIYTSISCGFFDNPIFREPGSGYRKKEEIKAKRHSEFAVPESYTIWRTKSGELSASFDSPNGNGVWTLHF